MNRLLGSRFAWSAAVIESRGARSATLPYLQVGVRMWQVVDAVLLRNLRRRRVIG